MPFLNLPIQATGPMITVNVGVSVFRQLALTQAGQTTPQMIQAQMLIDTGASLTAIDPSVISSLLIPQSGFGYCHTPSTGGVPFQCPMYDVQLWLPLGMPNQTFSPQPHSLSLHLQVMASDFLSQGIQGLIGRDILAGCHFTYNGKNSSFTLAV